MQRVLVIASTEKPLMPCHPARARALLREGKAAIFRRHPFTIILKERNDGATQPLSFKADPGSKATGMALVAECKHGRKVFWAGEIEHRGQVIKKALDQRRGIRRSRRNRHTRHRTPRFDNRRRALGTLPPSHMSRVHNVKTWAKRLQKYTPLVGADIETVRFDMQAMERRGIHGTEYQQGTLLGYEIREYLLERDDYSCKYCGIQNARLEIDHVVARAKGGSNRVSNLLIACQGCNQKKGDRSIEEFLASDLERLSKIRSRLKRPLKDAAAVNSTRHAIRNEVMSLGLTTSSWSGGRTKMNRVRQGHDKAHWIDAACIGEGGAKVFIPKGLRPLVIKATGHGDRQATNVDKYGFPRGKAKSATRVHGFRTGDVVRAVVPHGKRRGIHVGRVAVRAKGSFNIRTSSGLVTDVSHRYCTLLHWRDGYAYF